MPTTKPKRKEGPGAPSKLNDGVTTTLRLERAAHEKLQLLAMKRNRTATGRISTADIIREAIDEYLRRHPVTLPSY
jgi:predicted DNA-binding ribbon-helix-helix protein